MNLILFYQKKIMVHHFLLTLQGNLLLWILVSKREHLTARFKALAYARKLPQAWLEM